MRSVFQPSTRASTIASRSPGSIVGVVRGAARGEASAAGRQHLGPALGVGDQHPARCLRRRLVVVTGGTGCREHVVQ